MTWYAHEVIAPGSQEVVRLVEGNPMLAPFAYRLHGPLEHAWPRPEAAHGFPETGLVVVRPVCDLADDDAEWYGEPVLDWGLLHGSETWTETSSPLDPAAVAHACGVNDAFFPPESSCRSCRLWLPAPRPLCSSTAARRGAATSSPSTRSSSVALRPRSRPPRRIAARMAARVSW